MILVTTGSDKWVRSLTDNPAGKVLDAPNGRRWEWDPEQDDETARQLGALHNEELAIERSGIVPTPRGVAEPTADARPRSSQTPGAKPGGRDAGGGFNPYDNPGKPNRR